MKVLKRLLAILVLGILVILPHIGKAMAASNEQTSEPIPVIFDTGGPDSLDYVWEDNDNGGGPVYEWIDITSIGTQVTGLADDNTVGPVGMGFDFPYYGYTANQMWIGSNGYISFSSNITFAFPFAGIPDPSLPNDIIAILVGDLDFTQGNAECWYYTNGVDSFVISYLQVKESGDPNSSHTFQAIFAASDSSIKFQYGPNNGNFQMNMYLTLIGIEDVTGQVGLQYLYNNFPIQHLWHLGLAILFHPAPFTFPAIINADTSAIQFQVEVGDSVTVQRNISNTGVGELEFYIEARSSSDSQASFKKNNFREITEHGDNPDSQSNIATFSNNKYDQPLITYFQDSVFALSLEFLNDNNLLGIEFDGTYFWITGSNNSINPNKLYKLDAEGNYVAEYDQASSTPMGWLDLAFDGTYLYGSDDYYIHQIDPTTGTITGVTIIGPEIQNLALAYDPDTDHFFTAFFDSRIYEFDRNGNVVTSYANNKSIYGLAFDNVTPGGPYLWIFMFDDFWAPARIAQYDLGNRTYTGLSWQCDLPTGIGGVLPGGACFTFQWNPNIAVLFLLGRGSPHDFIYGYEIAPFVSWLNINPRYGVLQPGENIDLDITIDFSGDNIVPDSTYMANIYINNNTPVTPVIPVTATAIVIIYESVIRGIVSDTAGIPIYGVTVSADGTEMMDTTNSLGQYSLEDLASGNYNIAFSHPIYWDTTVTDVYVGESDTTELNVELLLQEPCIYVIGDINASGDYNTIDISYGVAYFKGGGIPVCDPCGFCPGWYYCGDVNGSCSYNGLDITYGVSYLKGGPDLVPCPDCPPLE